MNIYVDVRDALGCDGRVVAYCPQVEWSITSIDTLDVDELDKMKNRIQELVEEGLEKAHKEYLRKKNS